MRPLLGGGWLNTVSCCDITNDESAQAQRVICCKARDAAHLEDAQPEDLRMSPSGTVEVSASNCVAPIIADTF